MRRLATPCTHATHATTAGVDGGAGAAAGGVGAASGVEGAPMGGGDMGGIGGGGAGGNPSGSSPMPPVPNDGEMHLGDDTPSADSWGSAPSGDGELKWDLPDTPSGGEAGAGSILGTLWGLFGGDD